VAGLTPAELLGRIREASARLGLARLGVAANRPLPRGDLLRAWLDRGLGADMAHLARTAAPRDRPDLFAPWAASAIVVAVPYAARGAGAGPETPPVGQGLVARYARGRDYHTVLRARLARLAADVSELAGRPVQAEPFVDTSPLLEKELAVAAGLGRVGKNTLLEVPGLGSYVVLGGLLVDLELPASPPADSDGGDDPCGTCALCLEACPTRALLAPRLLDSHRCISYLTIEHRGPIEEELGRSLAPWIFGCDRCQEVCPRNFAPPPLGEAIVRPDSELAPPLPLRSLDLRAVVELGSGAHRRLVAGRALRRVPRRLLARNAALLLDPKSPGSG
jgi:epoxyqueuosine reductase